MKNFAIQISKLFEDGLTPEQISEALEINDPILVKEFLMGRPRAVQDAALEKILEKLAMLPPKDNPSWAASS